MVSERKKQLVKDLKADLNKYQVIGLLDMFKMPAKQLQEMRDKLDKKATIKMYRKNVIKLAIEGVEKSNLKMLEDSIQNQPALLLSEMNPFELARIINSAKSPAPAKEGDTAPKDIVVTAGPTNLKAGPVIGELQRAKIPAGVEGENIVIKSDVTVVKEGGKISRDVADILMKLGIQPMEIGLNLVCIWENGMLYGKDVLFVPEGKYLEDLKNAHSDAFNLSVKIGWITKYTVPLLLGRAHREALSLANEAGIMTKETVGSLLAKGRAEMESLKARLPEKAEEAAEKEENKDKSEV